MSQEPTEQDREEARAFWVRRQIADMGLYSKEPVELLAAEFARIRQETRAELPHANATLLALLDKAADICRAMSLLDKRVETEETPLSFRDHREAATLSEVLMMIEGGEASYDDKCRLSLAEQVDDLLSQLAEAHAKYRAWVKANDVVLEDNAALRARVAELESRLQFAQGALADIWKASDLTDAQRRSKAGRIYRELEVAEMEAAEHPPIMSPTPQETSAQEARQAELDEE